jgi:hypothetical protein
MWLCLSCITAATAATLSTGLSLDPSLPLEPYDKQAFCQAQREARNAACPQTCSTVFDPVFGVATICSPDANCILANEAKYQNCLTKPPRVRTNR